MKIQDRPYLLLTMAVLFWAGNFILGRAFHNDIPPVALAFWRWLGASVLVTWPALPHLRRDHGALTRAWPAVLLLALLGIASCNTLAYTGLQYTQAINAFLFLSLMPMMIVILSGIFGITVYSILPRQLSSNRDETTEAQMLETVSDIDRQLFDAAQPLDAAGAAIVQEALDETAFDGGLWQRLTGKYRGGGAARALSEFRVQSSAGGHPQDELYDRLEALLSRKLAALMRIRRHLRLKAMLQIWLYIHVPVTFGLLAALSAHIISVFFYW